MTSAEPGDWPALAAEVQKRRAELRLPVDLSAHGGPVEMTIRRIESGAEQSIRPKTKTRLEHALQWPNGAVDRILEGEASSTELDGKFVRGLEPDDALALGPQRDQRLVAYLVKHDRLDLLTPARLS